MAFHDEGRRLRALASDPDVLILIPPEGPRGHARQRMRERRISRATVERILKAGAVIEVERPLRGEERWKAQGTDVDGNIIHIVIIPRETEIEIEVITVFEP